MHACLPDWLDFMYSLTGNFAAWPHSFETCRLQCVVTMGDAFLCHIAGDNDGGLVKLGTVMFWKLGIIPGFWNTFTLLLFRDLGEGTQNFLVRAPGEAWEASGMWHGKLYFLAFAVGERWGLNSAQCCTGLQTQDHHSSPTPPSDPTLLKNRLSGNK